MNDEPTTRRPRWSMVSGVRGFTLVELMIVVVLLGLLAGLSIPTIATSMERNRLTQLNRDIANGFLQARSHAMRNGQAVLVDIETGADGGVTFYEPRDGGVWDAPSCVLAVDDDPDDNNTLISVNPGEYGLGVAIQQTDPNHGTICISPNGRVTATTGQPLEAGHRACDGEMNFLIPIKTASGAESEFDDLRDCKASVELSALREIDKFSMIHVAYGGQVRVIR